MRKILFVLAVVLCCGIFTSCNKQKALNKPITQELTNDECGQFTKMFESDFNVNSIDVVGKYEWQITGDKTKDIKVEDVKREFIAYHKTFGDYFNEIVQESVNDLLNTSTSKLSTNDKIVIEKLSTITYKNVYAFFKEKEILEHKLYTSQEWKEYEKRNEEWYKAKENGASVTELLDSNNEIYEFGDKLENKYVKEPLKRFNEDMWWMYYVYEWDVFYVLEENVHPYMKK